MPTVIYGERETTLTDADSEDGNLWLSLDDLEPATGWQLKPEGVCRGEQCVPIPPADSDDFLRGDHFNLTRFASHLGQPLVSDPGEDVWVFGEPVAPTGPLYAPDFTLPDLEGREHTLSDYRGNKVFLATWASW